LDPIAWVYISLTKGKRHIEGYGNRIGNVISNITSEGFIRCAYEANELALDSDVVAHNFLLLQRGNRRANSDGGLDDMVNALHISVEPISEFIEKRFKIRTECCSRPRSSNRIVALRMSVGLLGKVETR